MSPSCCTSTCLCVAPLCRCLPNQESWPQVWAEAQAARRLQTPAAAGPGAAPRPGPEAEPETARGDVPPATTVQGEAATEPGEALAAGSVEEDFIRLLNEPAGEPAEAVGNLTQALDAGLEGADAAAALAPSPKSDTDVVSLAAVPQASPGPEARAQGGTAPPPGLAQSTVPGLAPSDAPEAVDAVLEAAMDSSPVERAAAPDSVATNPAAGSVATAAAALPPSPALCTLGMHGAGVRLRTLSISLDGLLDYNLSDTGAGTFELSLLAEALADALALRYSGIIIGALRRDGQARARAARAQRKRARAGEEAGAGKRERAEGARGTTEAAAGGGNPEAEGDLDLNTPPLAEVTAVLATEQVHVNAGSHAKAGAAAKEASIDGAAADVEAALHARTAPGAEVGPESNEAPAAEVATPAELPLPVLVDVGPESGEPLAALSPGPSPLGPGPLASELPSGAESGVWGVTPASPGAVELEVEAPGDKSTTGEPGGSDLGGDLAGLFQDDDFVFAERLRSQGGMEVAAEEDAASAPVQPGEGGNGGAHLNDQDLAVSLTMAFRYFDAGGKGYLGWVADRGCAAEIGTPGLGKPRYTCVDRAEAHAGDEMTLS